MAALLALAGTSRAQGGFVNYQVKAGDGLDSIARRYHTSRQTLLEMNRLEKPDEIVVGQVLRVPKPVDELADPSFIADPNAKKPVRAPASIPAPQVVELKLVPVPTLPKPALCEAPVKRPAAVRTTAPAAPARPAAAVEQPKSAPVAAAVKSAPKPAATAKPFLSDYEEPRKNSGEMPVGRLILDLVVKLAVVLGIAYGAIYVLRLFMGRQPSLPGRKGHLKVIESASLGPNRSVHLIKIGGEVMVIGSTPEQITTIGKIEDPETLAQLDKEHIPPVFSAHLSGALAKDKKPELAEQFHGGIRHLWDRIQEIRGLQSTRGGASR